jgi:AraC family transcriptional activator FtrA
MSCTSTRGESSRRPAAPQELISVSISCAVPTVPRFANQVARRLVVPPHRDGGQSQYVSTPLPTGNVGGLARLLEWTQGNLHRPLTVEDLARKAAMSARSFARHFIAETGTTPHRWLTHQRLLAAQRRLETTAASIDQIAQAVGMQTAETLRHHFRRRFLTSPTAYRRRFTTALNPATAAPTFDQRSKR